MNGAKGLNSIINSVKMNTREDVDSSNRREQ